MIIEIELVYLAASDLCVCVCVYVVVVEGPFFSLSRALTFVFSFENSLSL
jgi:hypothetical protein